MKSNTDLNGGESGFKKTSVPAMQCFDESESHALPWFGAFCVSPSMCCIVEEGKEFKFNETVNKPSTLSLCLGWVGH